MRPPCLRRGVILTVLVSGLTTFAGPASGQEQVRPRAREVGIRVGVLPRGAWNAITVTALPLEPTLEILRRHRALSGDGDRPSGD